MAAFCVGKSTSCEKIEEAAEANEGEENGSWVPNENEKETSCHRLFINGVVVECRLCSDSVPVLEKGL